MLKNSVNFDEYVGVPFKEGGRDRLGCDCYGLVTLIYKERLGVVLPTFSNDYQTLEDRKAIENLIRGGVQEWTPIKPEDVLVYDALLMKIVGAPIHIGIIVGPNLVLHSEDGMNGSVVENYTAPRLRRRVIGAYRYERTN